MKNLFLRKYLYELISLFIGTCAFFCLFPIEILNIYKVDWCIEPTLIDSFDDRIQHYIGWLFYKNSSWDFTRPFYSDLLDNSIVFTDSIPWFSLIFKILQPVLGTQPYQFFGIFILFVFAMQSFWGYKLGYEVLKSNRIALIISIIFAFSPILIHRLLFHISLTSHWFFLASLYFYFRSRNTKKSNLSPWLFLCFSSMGIHPYYFPVILGFYGVALFSHYRIDNELPLKKTFIKSFIHGSILVVLCLILMGVMGFFSISKSATIHSLNGRFGIDLNTIYNPIDFFNKVDWSLFLDPIPIKGFRAYASFNYLGLGVLVLLLFSVFVFFKNKRYKTLFFKHYPLILFLVGLTVYAINKNIYFNDVRLFGYPIGPLKYIFSHFRDSSRFFWAVYYFLVLFAFYFLKDFPKKYSIFIAVLALLVQAIDLFPKLSNRSNFFYAHVKKNYPKGKHEETSLFMETKKGNLYYIRGYNSKEKKYIFKFDCLNNTAIRNLYNQLALNKVPVNNFAFAQAKISKSLLNKNDSIYKDFINGKTPKNTSYLLSLSQVKYLDFNRYKVRGFGGIFLASELIKEDFVIKKTNIDDFFSSIKDDETLLISYLPIDKYQFDNPIFKKMGVKKQPYKDRYGNLYWFGFFGYYTKERGKAYHLFDGESLDFNVSDKNYNKSFGFTFDLKNNYSITINKKEVINFAEEGFNLFVLDKDGYLLRQAVYDFQNENFYQLNSPPKKN